MEMSLSPALPLNPNTSSSLAVTAGRSRGIIGRRCGDASTHIFLGGRSIFVVFLVGKPPTRSQNGGLFSRRPGWGRMRRLCCYSRRPWRFHPRWVPQRTRSSWRRAAETFPGFRRACRGVKNISPRRLLLKTRWRNHIFAIMCRNEPTLLPSEITRLQAHAPFEMTK